MCKSPKFLNVVARNASGCFTNVKEKGEIRELVLRLNLDAFTLNKTRLKRKGDVSLLRWSQD